MNKDIIQQMNEWNRHHFFRLWQKTKTDDTHGLSTEDKRLIAVMLRHEDRYGPLFDNPDLPVTEQPGEDARNNPFLHLMIHSILEDQIERRDPIETYQFVLSMRNRGCDFHDALHMAEVILVYVFCTAVQEGMPFDMERYRFLLRKYRKRKPSKIPALLEQEFKGEVR